MLYINPRKITAQEEFYMINWKNIDTLASYQELKATEKVNLAAAMSGENGAERVKKYSVPMGEGLDFNYGARPVDDDILAVLGKFAAEAQLAAQDRCQFADHLHILGGLDAAAGNHQNVFFLNGEPVFLPI